MYEDRNQYQIIRKDARACFVESLSDTFPIGKIHFTFASYDMSKPSGQRQTNVINIYIAVGEFLELCRKLSGGEMRYLLQTKKKSGDKSPLYQCLGGTSAEKLARLGHARKDGMSLSRTAQLLCGNKSDFLFVADSGPGQTNAKGLIVPKFGNKPENHVAISMTFEAAYAAPTVQPDRRRWCIVTAGMVHGDRRCGAPGRHAENYSGMPLRLRMDSPSIWMV